MLSVLKSFKLASKTVIGCLLIGSMLASPIGYGIAASAETTGTPVSPSNNVVVQPKIIIQPAVVKKPAPSKTVITRKTVIAKKTVTTKKTVTKKNAVPKKNNKYNDPAANLTGKVKISTSAAMKPLAQDLIKAFNKKYKKVTVSVFGGQAGIGVLDVSNNKADLGIISRELSGDEISHGLSARKIGVDVIAMVVNSKNRVGDLSTSDIFNVYTRTITNWRELQGRNGKEGVIAFNTYSSSVGLGSLFDSVIMRGQKMSDRVVIHSTTGSMLNTVKLNKNAIGYASLSDIKRGLKIVTVNRVAPTASNARSGKYPFSRSVNMVTKGTNSAATSAFIQFTLSTDGQRLVQKYYGSIR